MKLVLQLSIALRQMKENSTQEHPTPRTCTDTHTYTQAGNLSCSQTPTLTTVWAQCRSPPNPNHHQTNEKPFRLELFKVPARMQQYSRSSVDDTRRARPGKSLPYVHVFPKEVPSGNEGEQQNDINCAITRSTEQNNKKDKHLKANAGAALIAASMDGAEC